MVVFFWTSDRCQLVARSQEFRSSHLSWYLHVKNVSLSDKEHWYTPVCPECRVVPLKGEALMMVGSDSGDALCMLHFLNVQAEQHQML